MHFGPKVFSIDADACYPGEIIPFRGYMPKSSNYEEALREITEEYQRRKSLLYDVQDKATLEVDEGRHQHQELEEGAHSHRVSWQSNFNQDRQSHWAS